MVNRSILYVQCKRQAVRETCIEIEYCLTRRILWLCIPLTIFLNYMKHCAVSLLQLSFLFRHTSKIGRYDCPLVIVCSCHRAGREFRGVRRGCSVAETVCGFDRPACLNVS